MLTPNRFYVWWLVRCVVAKLFLIHFVPCLFFLKPRSFLSSWLCRNKKLRQVFKSITFQWSYVIWKSRASLYMICSSFSASLYLGPRPSLNSIIARSIWSCFIATQINCYTMFDRKLLVRVFITFRFRISSRMAARICAFQR